ncbi:MAG: DUF1517 domain-containing protein [Polyangiales bacterium]
MLLFALVGAWWIAIGELRGGWARARRRRAIDRAARRGGERLQTMLPRVARGLASTRAATRRSAWSWGRCARRRTWVFGRIVDHLPRAVGPARRDLERHASELRARYRHARGSEDARADDESLVVVSMVVAARGTIEDARTVSVERLDALLRGLCEISSDRLVALEITWSPTRAHDRLGSAELEVVYPELVRLADPRVARVTCMSCGATSAGELAACPSCGTAHPAIASASGPVAEEAQHAATRSLREIMRAKHEPT